MQGDAIDLIRPRDHDFITRTLNFLWKSKDSTTAITKPARQLVTFLATAFVASLRFMAQERFTVTTKHAIRPGLKSSRGRDEDGES